MTDKPEPAMADSRGRGALVMRLMVTAIATCATVPIMVGTVGRSVGGWDETVGFVAALLVASVGIAWLVSASR